MFFAGLLIKYRKAIPGGRARGFRVKNYLHQSSKIIVNLQPRAGVFHNYRILSSAKQDPLGVKLFCAIVQIKLDMRTRCAYNGAGRFLAIIVALLLAPKDLRNYKKFCPHP